MKISLRLLLLVIPIVFYSCGKKTEDHAHHEETEAVSTDPNKALNDSVMAVHNEVMPKLDNIFRLSESLKDKIAKTPDMQAEKKKEIEAAIDSLNKASDGMMIWMRKFVPPSPTADPQEARTYLQEEMVKVQRVKSDILTSIERGKALQ
ncbi:hypothetical protein WBG78_24320 [Chryseolinea sp. T2]|uniref:hypothetical protein n=1 Tax=Chryseolinea sp. T2 TaxID=3129255 RepID=UPI0030786395